MLVGACRGDGEMWRARIRETSSELPQTFLVCQLLRTLSLHELQMLLGEEGLGLLLLLEVNLALQLVKFLLPPKAGCFLASLCSGEGLGVDYRSTRGKWRVYTRDSGHRVDSRKDRWHPVA